MQTTVATAPYIGVDVSKDTLVSCVHSSGVRRTLANHRGAVEAWLSSLPAGSSIGMEATSTYHELLADLAQLKGMLVYVLNPKDVRHYAKGAVTSPAWKPLYQHYLAKELSRTAALVIIARKIARTAWSVYTHNSTFDPQRLTSGLT